MKERKLSEYQKLIYILKFKEFIVITNSLISNNVIIIRLKFYNGLYYKMMMTYTEITVFNIKKLHF